jgi:hypothetical protein
VGGDARQEVNTAGTSLTDLAVGVALELSDELVGHWSMQDEVLTVSVDA